MRAPPDALDAVRRRLVEHPHLADVLSTWGPHAGDAVPELVAVPPALAERRRWHWCASATR
ncbi:hypothetical protein ACFO0M_27625 [Micromonospora mangrovi]|uniref:Uncharacterized protein n=2 Tax=Micromonospora TaxID=1873 RepID=A0AAU7ME38_9ACTN